MAPPKAHPVAQFALEKAKKRVKGGKMKLVVFSISHLIALMLIHFWLYKPQSKYLTVFLTVNQSEGKQGGLGLSLKRSEFFYKEKKIKWQFLPEKKEKRNNRHDFWFSDHFLTIYM